MGSAHDTTTPKFCDALSRSPSEINLRPGNCFGGSREDYAKLRIQIQLRSEHASCYADKADHMNSRSYIALNFLPYYLLLVPHCFCIVSLPVPDLQKCINKASLLQSSEALAASQANRIRLPSCGTFSGSLMISSPRFLPIGSMLRLSTIQILRIMALPMFKSLTFYPKILASLIPSSLEFNPWKANRLILSNLCC